MGIVLGANQYGKAENRVVRIYRDTDRHEIRDLNVSTSLRGDFAAAHVSGDQSQVLPTDTQKNTAFAYAKEHGVTSPEDYALALGRRLLGLPGRRRGRGRASRSTPGTGSRSAAPGTTTPSCGGARETRTRSRWCRGDGGVRSGLTDLTVLKSTGSEFKGFLVDEYTTLAETDDRILATSLTATWRHGAAAEARDWDASYAAVRALLLETFATTYSHALQETLHAMGRAVLEAHDDIAEISFVAPNRHHFLVDLAPFGLENPGEVFFAADRPYGLIEATVTRDEE